MLERYCRGVCEALLKLAADVVTAERDQAPDRIELQEPPARVHPARATPIRTPLTGHQVRLGRVQIRRVVASPPVVIAL